MVLLIFFERTTRLRALQMTSIGFWLGVRLLDDGSSDSGLELSERRIFLSLSKISLQNASG